MNIPLTTILDKIIHKYLDLVFFSFRILRKKIIKNLEVLYD